MPEGRRNIHFDPTINLGHLVSAAVFLVTAGVAYASMDARVGVLERELKRQTDRGEQVGREKENTVSVENRLLGRINEERARFDQTQVRTADDIREIKMIVRDGFCDLEADKPGR